MKAVVPRNEATTLGGPSKGGFFGGNDGAVHDSPTHGARLNTPKMARDAEPR
jgi:hypothetical protein